MFRQIIAVALLATCAYAGIVGNYIDCGSTSTVNQFRVTGCESMPCVFTKGLTYTIEVDATARSSSNTLPYRVTATVVIPIVIKEGDACDDLTAGSCPAVVGNSFTYQYVFEVPSDFPQINTRVTANVKDDSGAIVICAQLDVHIRNSQRQTLEELVSYIQRSQKTLRL